MTTYRATYRTRVYRVRGRQQRARTPPVPGLRHEHALRQAGVELIGGVDEVGLGAWAGPLAVGMVVLRPDKRIYKVRDSKLLDEPRREWLAGRIKAECLCWSTGLAWPREIDRLGLSEAMRLAAGRALGRLAQHPDCFLVDGQWNFLQPVGCGEPVSHAGPAVRTVVRGDCESVSIAAASVVAKVARDGLMAQLGVLYPPYLFRCNKGYPSPDHKWALCAFGPSPVHRRLFAPVRKLVDEGVPGRLLPDLRHQVPATKSQGRFERAADTI